MAQGKNKPDLSDLKARLGLKKQGAAKETEDAQGPAQPQAAPGSPGHAGPQAQTPADGPGPASGPPHGGPPQGGPPQGGPAHAGPPQAGPPGGGAPPQASGPPPGAQGPPPGAGGPQGGQPSAAASPQRSQPSQPSGPSRNASASSSSAASSTSSAGSSASTAPAADIELDDEDLKAAGGSAFSPATIILMVALLLVGVIFGWVASSSMQNREVYNARGEDAARIHEALKPKVATLDEAKKLVGKLKPTEPDYDTLKKLSELEIAPDGNLLGGNRLLLGPELIDYITSYTVDANMLQQMLEEHHRATKADKKEIEQLVQGNEVVKKDRFAVLFDYDHLAQRSGGDDYMPKQGRLVTVGSLEKDDDGQIEVALLNSDRTIKTKVQGILPLPKGDILDSGGPNALKRYQQRVARIQRQLLKFENYRGAMMEKLKALGEKDSAPLLNF